MKRKKLLSALIAASCCLAFASGGCLEAAPAAPQGVRIPAAATDSTSTLLVWQRPADNDTAVAYNVYANGQFIGSTKNGLATKAGAAKSEFQSANESLCGNLLIDHNYKVTGLKPATSYTFTVRAIDKSGAESPDSAAVVQATTAAPQVLKVTDYGAKGDGTTLNTAAIQKAIDATPAGGVLEIPAGTFVSGSLYLKSDMTLQLDKGAVLLESAKAGDIELGQPRYKGLINVKGNLQNLRIVGEGAIDGNGWKMSDDATYYLKAKNIENKGRRNDMHVLNIGIGAAAQTQASLDRGLAFKAAYNTRSTTVMLKNVTNLYLDGVTLRNPAMHMLSVDASQNVTLNDVDVFTYNANNGDGIDFDGNNLIIVNSVFDTGDDAINFSAGMGAAAAKNPPVSDIWLFNNYIKHGHGGIVLGSHTGSWIQNLVGEDNIFDGTEISLRCKTGQGVGGGGRNVTFRHSVAKNMKRQGIIFTTAYTDVNAVGTFEAAAPGQFHDILVEDVNIDGTGKAAIEINGVPEMKHKDITFRNVHFTRTHENKLDNYENVKFENVTYDYAE